jgi:hypothetical protein
VQVQIDMITTHQDWQENEQEHIQERLATEEAIRTGKKTAWQVQEENSIIPTNARIKIDWVDLSKRFETDHARTSL